MQDIYEGSKEYQASRLPQNQGRWQQIILETRQFIDKRTTAAQRLLYTLHSCFEASGFQLIDRPTIARALGRPGGLTPWDRKLLKLLVEKTLITCQRVALKSPGGVVRGAEYRYGMSLDIGYRLHIIRTDEAA